MKSPHKCSFCRQSGHNRTTCEVRGTVGVTYEAVNKKFLSRLGTNMNHRGLIPGALMKSRFRGDGLYVFNEFEPNDINIGNLYQPSRSKKLALPPRDNPFFFSAKRITSQTPELMYVDNPMTLPNEYAEHPSFKSSVRPEGWMRHMMLTFDGPGVYNPPFSDDYGADVYEILDTPKSDRCMKTELTSAPGSNGFDSLEKHFIETASKKDYSFGSYMLEALMRYMWILDDYNDYEPEFKLEESALNHVRWLRKRKDWVHTTDGQLILNWKIENPHSILTYSEKKR